jgi:ribokinase
VRNPRERGEAERDPKSSLSTNYLWFRGATYDRAVPPQLTVVGSVNLDLVARVERLPRAGETLTASSLERIPGGKGANQAVAAARLGAQVRFVGCVGRDAVAPEALVNLRGLELDVREADVPTGLALIFVDEGGENEIVVVPGANAEVDARSASGSVLCQLEIPDDAIALARANADWLCVNAAPARPFEVDADLVVANRYELEVIGPRRGLVALTLGAEGAVLLEDGNEVVRSRAPKVDAVDGTAAGDAFTAALVVSLLEGREREDALRRACAAGAIAASRFGAQASLPTADEVDAILRR